MKALLSDDIDAMNYYMNQIIMTTFSYFDVGQNEPERFYHGFVLGLIADQTDIKVRNIKREESLEDTVQTALTQIKEKCYGNALRDYSGILLLVGINYNKSTKKHECIIESVQK